MEDGEGPRGQAQNTPYLQSQWRTAEHSYWSHTFHCTSTKGTEQGRQVKAGALWHTKAGKTKQFDSHSPAGTLESKPKYSSHIG